MAAAAAAIARAIPGAAAAGGYAMQVYGSDRLTSDLDVVARRFPEGLRRGTALTFGGFATKAPDGTPVDVIVRADGHRALYASAVRAAVRLPGVPIAVVDRAHLAVIKMVAKRGKDLLDLQYLLGTLTPAEQAKGRALVEKYVGAYATDDWDAEVDEAAWRAAKLSRDRPSLWSRRRR
jgi:hypothetical protein